MSKLAIFGGSKVIKNPLPAYKSINKRKTTGNGSYGFWSYF